MNIKSSRAILAAALGIAVVGSPVAATAERSVAGTTDVLRARLEARLAETDAKLSAARRGGRIAPAQVRAIAKRLAWVRTDSARLEREQGFLSAGESASYNRVLDGIAHKLNR